MKKVPFRSSAFVAALFVDPIRGTAIARYINGRTYSYKNVSRRSIINILLNPSISTGFWVNKNLRNDRVTITNQSFA